MIDSISPAKRLHPPRPLELNKWPKRIALGLSILVSAFVLYQWGRFIERGKEQLWRERIEKSYAERDAAASRGARCPRVLDGKRLSRSKIDRVSASGPFSILCAYD